MVSIENHFSNIFILTQLRTLKIINDPWGFGVLGFWGFGNPWELLGALGSSWESLGARGSLWELSLAPLGTLRSPWELLGVLGSHWESLGLLGSSW